jgi:hypothetical protein
LNPCALTQTRNGGAPGLIIYPGVIRARADSRVFLVTTSLFST